MFTILLLFTFINKEPPIVKIERKSINCSKRVLEERERVETILLRFSIVDFHQRTWKKRITPLLFLRIPIISFIHGWGCILSPSSNSLARYFHDPTKKEWYINGCIDSSWAAFVSGREENGCHHRTTNRPPTVVVPATSFLSSVRGSDVG